jgi:ABC-type nickel/cobalt efflux system permease component RcnA
VVDWIANGVTLLLVIVGFLLVLREWRRANQLAADQIAVAQRQVNTTAQHANSIDRLAAAITSHAHATTHANANATTQVTARDEKDESTVAVD